MHGLCCLSEEIEITVERYGFKAYGKADFPDPISAELKLIVKYGDHNHFSFDYPGQYDINLPLMPLEKARSDAEAAAMGLANAIVLVAQNVRMKLSERG